MADTTKLCFVGATGGNYFMNELLAAVAHAVRAEGVEAEVTADAFPPADQSTIYVVIPHEYFVCAPPAGHPTSDQLARTIAFCVEQPGTSWFEVSCRHAARAAAAVDIQRSSVNALRRRGLPAEHFRLGYTAYWDRWGRDEQVDRPVDILYMGSANERRARILAGYGRTLWPRATRLLVPPEAPKTERRADYLLEEEKWRCLRSAKTLLNVHRQETTFFEWARVLEAIANGCVVVSEHSTDSPPLIPGEHYVSGTAENLALLADGLLEDGQRLREIRLGAYDFVRSELSMQPSAQRLIAIADSLRGRTRRAVARQLTAAVERVRLETVRALVALPSADGATPPAATQPGDSADPSEDRHQRPQTMVRGQASMNGPGNRLSAAVKRPPLGAASRLPMAAVKRLLLADPQVRTLLQGLARASRLSPAVKRLALADLDMRRTLQAQRLMMRGEDPDELRVIARTPAYHRATVRVSVIMPLYNHAAEVEGALRSIVCSDYPDLEVVVLDDASSDESVGSVVRFFEANPFLPGMLLQHPVNRGPAPSRNALLKQSRGEFVFALDSDNEIYPPALSRLVSELDEDREALFAYPMFEHLVNGVPAGLVSFLPWEPERLRRGNYIDTMALLRRREVIELGGYEEDLRLHGWEDYDLWCRCAERGRHGVSVPQILGRYHQSPHGVRGSVTDIDDAEMRWLLRQRYPRLMNAEAP